jgi:mannose-6-phosphate isomerase-like protein (cupin superfamily)
VGAEPGNLMGIVTPAGYEQLFIELGQSVKPTPKATAALEERLGIVDGPYGPAVRPPELPFTRAVVSYPERQRIVQSFGDRQILHLTAAETGGLIGVYEAHDVPGQGPPWHIHSREDEMFRVLAGNYRFEIGDDVIECGPATTIVAPRGVRHRWRNIGDSNGLLLFAVTPGGFEGFFADIAALSSPDEASMAVLKARYGMSGA